VGSVAGIIPASSRHFAGPPSGYLVSWRDSRDVSLDPCPRIRGCLFPRRRRRLAGAARSRERKALNSCS